MAAVLSHTVYAPKEPPPTEGPMVWISRNGRAHGESWLLKSDHFHADLDPIAQTFTGNVSANLAADAPLNLQSERSLEDLVKQTKPAVVYLKGLEKSGTGFFVTDTGVIATNAHVARRDESLLARLPR